MLTYGLDLDYPYPQAFSGMRVNIIVTRNKLYILTRDNTLVRVPVLNEDGDEVEFSAKKPWHFIDLGNNFILVDGTAALFTYGNAEFVSESTPNVYYKEFTAETGCYSRGRCFFGGFYEDIWDPAWTSFYASKLLEDGDVTHSLSLENQPNAVWYSSVGAGDSLWFLKPSLYIGGGVYNDEGYDYALDFIKRNESAFITMSWPGRVLKVSPLGNHVIVYGTGGISALVFSPEANVYGEVVLSKSGVLNRDLCGGNEGRHFAVLADGGLISINPNLEVSYLDYREFFYGLDTAYGVLILDEKGRCYITDGYTSYLMSEGLSHIDQVFTSMISAIHPHAAFCTRPGMRNKEMLIETDTFDLNLSGIKNVMSAHLSCDSDVDMYVAFKYRVKRSGEFNVTPWRLVNNQGLVYPSVAGVEFRLMIKTEDFTLSEPPDNVLIYWYLADKVVGGIYAGQTGGNPD